MRQGELLTSRFQRASGFRVDVDLGQHRPQEAQQSRSFTNSKVRRSTMLKYILAGLATFVLLTATLIPDDAYARRGGGGGGGGFRGGGGGFHGGGGMHAGRMHGGGGYRHAGGVRPSHPIAGRPIAGRPGRPIAGRPGYGGGYYRPGWGYGAAAVGAAAAYGAYGYYGNNYGCYYDNYGQYICPQQYQY
jgi:hypothetical protein